MCSNSYLREKIRRTVRTLEGMDDRLTRAAEDRVWYVKRESKAFDLYVEDLDYIQKQIDIMRQALERAK